MNENQVLPLIQPEVKSSFEQNVNVVTTTDDPGKFTRTVGSLRAVDLISVNCLQLITIENARILTWSLAS